MKAVPRTPRRSGLEKRGVRKNSNKSGFQESTLPVAEDTKLLVPFPISHLRGWFRNSTVIPTCNAITITSKPVSKPRMSIFHSAQTIWLFRGVMVHGRLLKIGCTGLGGLKQGN